MFVGLLGTIVVIGAILVLLRYVLPAFIAAFYVGFKVLCCLWWIFVVVLLISSLFAIVF